MSSSEPTSDREKFGAYPGQTPYSSSEPAHATSANAEDSMEGFVGPDRRLLPGDRTGFTHKVNIKDKTTGQWHEGYIIGNTFPDGTLGEIMLHGFGKEGSTMEGWTQVVAILFSILMQYKNEALPMVCRKLAHMKFEPHGVTGNPEIPECKSIPDYIAQWLVLRFGSPALRAEIQQIEKGSK